MITKKERSKIGRQNKQKGQRFELSVCKDLESQGWIVDRWSSNVQLGFEMEQGVKGEEGYVWHKEYPRLIPAKSGIFRLKNTGFPDFIAFKPKGRARFGIVYNIIGVECKSRKYLDATEKEKCKWLLENGIFNQILIASKSKKQRGKIEYNEFGI